MRTGSSVRSLPSRVLDLLATAVPVFSASSVDLLFRGIGLGLLDLVLVDDVDAHVREHRHDVLDLVGRDLIRGQNRVQLFIGDVTALLGGLDQLLYGSIGKVEQGRIRRLGRRRCGAPASRPSRFRLVLVAALVAICCSAGPVGTGAVTLLHGDDAGKDKGCGPYGPGSVRCRRKALRHMQNRAYSRASRSPASRVPTANQTPRSMPQCHRRW